MLLQHCTKAFATVLPLCLLTSFNLTGQSALPACRINLKSSQGKFLSATRKFEQTVEALVDDANTDELLVMTDDNDGSLQSGDPVRLFAHSGYFTIGQNNPALAATGKPEESTEFKIIKVNGQGAIAPGDVIELQTPSGDFITVEANGKLTAHSGASEAAELMLTTGVDNAAIAEAFSQHWQRGYNITFDNSAQAAFGKSLQNAATIKGLKAPGSATVASAVKKAKTTTAAVVPKPVPLPAAPRKAAQSNVLPASLPLGYYKCYVDHVANLSLAGYFTLLPGNKYIYHGFEPGKKTGVAGTYHYDATSGKINWLSGTWKSNHYYGIYSLDKVYGDRIYLIPNGSDYSACKCFLQSK